MQYLMLRIPTYYLRELIPIASFAASFFTLGLSTPWFEIAAAKAGGLPQARPLAPLLRNKMGNHIRIIPFFEQWPLETVQTIGTAPPLHRHQFRIEHLQCIRSAAEARRHRGSRRQTGLAELRLIADDDRQIHFRYRQSPRHADRRDDAARPSCRSRRAAAA